MNGTIFPKRQRMDESKIRTLIVDDEFHARENLKFLIEENSPQIEVIGAADGVKSALQYFHKFKPELLFLDIRMPSGAEGFDLLEELKGEKFQVIFVTAFKDYAIRAFERRALHYILKPIDEEDLRESVERILIRRKFDSLDAGYDKFENLKEEVETNAEPERITVNHSKGVRIVELAELEYLQSSGNCTILFFKSGDQYLDTRTMKIYEAILPGYFQRVHRSFIVNLREASEILHGDHQEIVLKSKKHIPISRERKKDLTIAIQNIL